MVSRMELDELLDREGLDPDEVMTWAQRRAEQLLAELSGESDELLRLLEPAAQIDIENVPVRRVAVVDDMLPVSVGPAPTHVEAPASAQVEEEVEESITAPIAIEVPVEVPVETDAAEVGARGRRRVPSTPQPLSASELSPPPEHPRLADGEPEPMLETFDTGPIDLGTAEARAMIAANSTREPEPEPEPEAAVEAADASEEFEIDDLEELDDEELELMEEEAGDDDSDAGVAPSVMPGPPPRPPSKPGVPPSGFGHSPALAVPSSASSDSDNSDGFDIDVD
jgi:hypothetical protein